MKTALLIIFGVLSMAVCGLFIRHALRIHKKESDTKWILSAVQVITIGVFFSVWLLFIPTYYTYYCFGDPFTVFRPLLIAVHNTLRVFILDGEFDIIVNTLQEEPLLLRLWISLYAALLYVLAPFLTFSNVLSLFKNIRSKLRYQFQKAKKYCIMSELNKKSIALAKSILADGQDAVIVFADVFEQNEEKDYELLTEARDINAICLKQDVAHLNILLKKVPVEIFLIGEDESENVSQAVRITNDLNTKRQEQKKQEETARGEKNQKRKKNRGKGPKGRDDQKDMPDVKIFVFSQSASAAYIIDSIEYDSLLTIAGEQESAEASGEQEYVESSFKLRRIDEKQNLIWNTVPKMKLFDVAQRNDNTLSVLIAGFGSYGMEFFETILWFCQFEGYRLEINIVDKQGTEARNHVRSLIDRNCPDLMKHNRAELSGEARYDIRIIPGVDLETADFDGLLLYEGDDEEKKALSQRLKKTNVAFVGLGDDDLNIEVAVHLRKLYDRAKGVKAKPDTGWDDEPVDIYAVVYDEQKSGILHHKTEAASTNQLLVNHKGVPYHIRFIGSMPSQFAYKNIYDFDVERQAYIRHCEWVSIEESVYREWEAAGETEKIEKHDWYFWGEKTPEAVARARRNFEKYEYYRRSSLAKELYSEAVKSNAVLKEQIRCLEEKEGKKMRQTCQCANCIRRKRSEHMRWNAYTRVIGYSYQDGIRDDRAGFHDCLREWDKLTELARQKD